VSSGETRPLPQPTADTQPYWEAAREGELLLQRCDGCRRYQFYPRPYCVKCLSERLSWVPSEGRGTIYTYTIVHRAAHLTLQGRTPYAIVVVDLGEGVRMMANIVDSDLTKIRIGAKVVSVFEKASEEITLPQFRLLAS